jgi:phosphoglycerate dehydrogenase-like enzyme
VRVLILLTLPEPVRAQYYAGLKEKFPDVEFRVADHHSKAAASIRDVDALVTFGPMLHDDVLKAARNLKWIQALGTGVDGIVDQPSLPKEVVVTKMHGFHGIPVSEAAMLAMLALARDLPRAVRSQAMRKWDRFPARTLDGKTAGILGVGAIAETLAPMCKAFGMRVVGLSSSPRVLPGFDEMFHRSDLARVAAELDYLVLLTPLTEETRGIVNAEVLGAMKRSAFLVNLARGGVVDEAALLASLQKNQIGGAALDVFAKEPLPEDSPFWALPNVLITPHAGGFFDDYPKHALPTIEENLRRFLAGDMDHMINRVPR